MVVFAASGSFLGSFSGRVALFAGVLSGVVDPQLSDFVSQGGSGGPLVNPQFLAFRESSAPEPSSIAMLALALGCGGSKPHDTRRTNLTKVFVDIDEALRQ